jgi:hypothetical protein
MEVALAALAASVVILASLTWVSAQGQYLRVDGRIQWIAGEKMMLIPQSGGGVPLNVDLTQIPQEQYSALTQGTLVTVNGVVSYDGRRVIAMSITIQPVPEEQVTLRPPSKW